MESLHSIHIYRRIEVESQSDFALITRTGKNKGICWGFGSEVLQSWFVSRAAFRRSRKNNITLAKADWFKVQGRLAAKADWSRIQAFTCLKSRLWSNPSFQIIKLTLRSGSIGERKDLSTIDLCCSSPPQQEQSRKYPRRTLAKTSLPHVFFPSANNLLVSNSHNGATTLQSKS